MTGRTTKSLRNTWTKIQKEIITLEEAGGGGGSGAGTQAPALKGKRTRKSHLFLKEV